MERMKNLLSVLLVLMVSCGTKTDKLEFSEFEIKDENGKTRISVNENGAIKISGENIGKINKDGTLEDKEGKLLVKITEDIILQDKDGQALIKIDKNGTMDNGSGTFIKWSDSGELWKGNEKTGMIISPVDQESLQTASIILFLYLSVK